MDTKETTTTKMIRELKPGQHFKLKKDAKRTWIMGDLTAKNFWNFTRHYDRSTKKYTCVPADDVLSGGREFSGYKKVFTCFTY